MMSPASSMSSSSPAASASISRKSDKVISVISSPFRHDDRGVETASAAGEHERGARARVPWPVPNQVQPVVLRNVGGRGGRGGYTLPGWQPCGGHGPLA